MRLYGIKEITPATAITQSKEVLVKNPDGTLELFDREDLADLIAQKLESAGFGNKKFEATVVNTNNLEEQ